MRIALAITPLHPHIGAEVGGLDLSRPIDDEIVAELWRAIDRHAVLVFHRQQISDRQPTILRRALANWRSGAGRCRVAGGGCRSRRSATSPISTRITGCAPATTGGV